LVKKLKILIVEDEASIVRGVIRRLKNHFDILAASDVKTAWRLFDEHQSSESPIEIILLDGLLIGENTLELLRHFRESGFNGKIISITGNSSMHGSMFPADPDRPRCDDHIPKSQIVNYLLHPR
jgi:two-component system, OmpR family, response regulator CiaR